MRHKWPSKHTYKNAPTYLQLNQPCLLLLHTLHALLRSALSIKCKAHTTTPTHTHTHTPATPPTLLVAPPHAACSAAVLAVLRRVLREPHPSHSSCSNQCRRCARLCAICYVTLICCEYKRAWCVKCYVTLIRCEYKKGVVCNVLSDSHPL
jgi:hypothetical protein